MATTNTFQGTICFPVFVFVSCLSEDKRSEMKQSEVPARQEMKTTQQFPFIFD
jgi:hypothetical protein